MAPKKKAEKMTLGNFLSDQSLGSWAEEMDDMPLPSSHRSGDSRSAYSSERRDFGSRQAFGSDRDMPDRSFQSREQLPLPTKPPYTAHLGNLSFDATQADIEDFFAGCQVTSVRIVEEKIDRKPKGFGYVEFDTLEGLKKALDLSGSQLQGRNVRISVADPPKDRGEARELNDWTRKGPLPELASNQRRPSERSFRGSEDAVDRDRAGPRRAPPEQGDDKLRDLSTWERKGPLQANAASAAPAAAPAGEGRGSIRRNDRSFDRHASPSWGEGKSPDSSRPPRRDFSERQPPPERQPTAADLDNQWRVGMKPNVAAAAAAAAAKSPTPTPDASLPSSPVATTAVPATRPRLNLQKRTISDIHQVEQATPSGDSKASPFGAARPIDTAAREREIEEKMIASRQKKEEEDRERKAKLDAEKATEKAKAADSASAVAASPTATTPASSAAAAVAAAGTSTSAPANAPTGPRENGRSQGSTRTRGPEATTKENGASTPTAAPGSSFEILRRMTEQENGEADNDAEAETEADGRNAPSNGNIIGDKEVKPRDIVNDTAAGQQQQTPETSAQALEGDGWATVTKPGKKGRGGGGQAARALAS